jgi:hypothetical protein
MKQLIAKRLKKLWYLKSPQTFSRQIFLNYCRTSTGTKNHCRNKYRYLTCCVFVTSCILRRLFFRNLKWCQHWRCPYRSSCPSAVPTALASSSVWGQWRSFETIRCRRRRSLGLASPICCSRAIFSNVGTLGGILWSLGTRCGQRASLGALSRADWRQGGSCRGWEGWRPPAGILRTVMGKLDDL